MKSAIWSIPFLGPLAEAIYQSLNKGRYPFPGSKKYWDNRYRSGGNSGAGSYGKLALFKAEVLNDFVKRNHIETVIEFGCGDGNQLTLSKYPSYVGIDVSERAIAVCKERFQNDPSKRFRLLTEHQGETAELTISLDVIFHLVEDEIFSNYMVSLFDSSTRFVIIYSSNSDGESFEKAPHVKHREFTLWVRRNRPQWQLIQKLNNRYPYAKGDEDGTSFSDFYFFSL